MDRGRDMKKTGDGMTLGLVVGNRDVFPTALAAEGRKEILNVLKKAGVKTVSLAAGGPEAGLVSGYRDAKKCAALFDRHRGEIDGVLVTLPNFGDERAVADTIRMSGLDVPVFVHAFSDDLDKMQIGQRRDSFCGKLSVCNNLTQYGIPYSVGEIHVVSPQSGEFMEDLSWFMAVCRVAGGLRGARIGCIGSRIPAFKTVRFSEKLLEESGISVETVDLQDIILGIGKLSSSSKKVQSMLSALKKYAPPTEPLPAKHQLTIAKMTVVIEQWIKENDIDAYTIQCWPAMQEALSVFPCTAMSLMSQNLVPAACETDVMGAVSMYALQLASGTPSALLDWNNNYGEDPDKAVLFHCSNCPRSMMTGVTIGYNVIADSVIGKDKSFTTCHGCLKAGPLTFARVSTDDVAGEIVGYVGEGELTDDPIKSFGGVGVVQIDRLQPLLRFLCRSGFEHHMALSQTFCADALFEAFTNYLGWDIYYHNG